MSSIITIASSFRPDIWVSDVRIYYIPTTPTIPNFKALGQIKILMILGFCTLKIENTVLPSEELRKLNAILNANIALAVQNKF